MIKTLWYTEPTATGTTVYAERGQCLLRCSAPAGLEPGRVLKLLEGMQFLINRSIAREKAQEYGQLH